MSGGTFEDGRAWVIVYEQEFARIKNKKFTTAEEVKYDVPVSTVNGFIYVGVAPIGTATSAAAWSVIRTAFDAAGNPSGDRIRTAIVWDNRSAGW